MSINKVTGCEAVAGQTDSAHVAGIMDICQEWAWQMDDAGIFTFSSSLARNIVGFEPAELIGRSYLSLMPVQDAISFGPALMKAMREGRVLHRTLHRMVRKDGQTVLLDMNGAPLPSETGTASGYCGVCRLVTNSIMEPVGDAISPYCDLYAVALFVLDREGRFVNVNTAFAHLVNLSPAEIEGRTILDIIPAGDVNFRRDIQAFDRGESVPAHEFVWRGRIYLVAVKPVRDAQGHTIGASVSFTDVSIYKRAERILAAANERLQATAERDFLTGLLNRRQFEEVYRVEVSAARREQAPVSLLIIDVDQFKLYNDHYGHPAGDKCLRRVAQALSANLSRPRDVVCRYGGEEFVSILPSTHPHGAMAVAERLRKAVWELNIPHVQSGHGRISVSIGVSSLMNIGSSGDMAKRRRLLLEAADGALYAAKRQGRNSVCAAEPVNLS